MIYKLDNIGGPQYILPNGEFLCIIKTGSLTHYEYETKNKYITDNRRRLVNLKGYIRINDRLPKEVLAELPIKEVTKEQYESLELFFNNLLDKGITFVEIGIEPDGSKIRQWTDTVLFYNKFDLLETKPEYIIQIIKNYYKQRKSSLK